MYSVCMHEHLYQLVYCNMNRQSCTTRDSDSWYNGEAVLESA